MKPDKKIDLSSIDQLTDELAGAITNLADYHTLMQTFGNYYRYSAFYKRKAGDPQANLSDNWLKIFADKNIHYTSEEPQIKVAGTPEDRENADIREKILLAVRRKSGMPLLRKKWARDATKFSVAIAETGFDLEKRCAFVKRYDPRYCFWKMSNGNEDKVTAFWAVFPITKKEAKETYGVVPTKDVVSANQFVSSDPYFQNMDGQDWFTMVIRWDETHRTAFIGDRLIEEPHEHNMGVIPIDICAPFPSDERNKVGHFYLEDLVPMQAELNDTVRRRSNIVKRMSNPIIWGRNIQQRGYDDVKDALEKAETGILGLGKDGEVGILQLSEIRMLNEHETTLKSDMQRLSGFAAASFGESVGANTSGEALGMYFTPTQKHIDDQNISWVAFDESINAKILRMYDVFGRTGEKFSLEGYSPRSTISATGDENQTTYTKKLGGDYKLQFTREAINGNYNSRAIPSAVIPKNELAEKQFWAKSMSDGIVSHTTGYEKLGLESPEDEKNLLLIEKGEPLLNPTGIGDILKNMPQPALPAGGATPTVPPPPNLAAGVTPNGA